MTDIVARTVKDFCRVYGVGRTTAYELMRQGALSFRHVGKRTLILEDSARAWLNGLPIEPTSAPTFEATIARKRKRTKVNSKLDKVLENTGA